MLGQPLNESIIISTYLAMFVFLFLFGIPAELVSRSSDGTPYGMVQRARFISSAVCSLVCYGRYCAGVCFRQRPRRYLACIYCRALCKRLTVQFVPVTLSISDRVGHNELRFGQEPNARNFPPLLLLSVWTYPADIDIMQLLRDFGQQQRHTSVFCSSLLDMFIRSIFARTWLFG